jgi:hypothetical protein
MRVHASHGARCTSHRPPARAATRTALYPHTPTQQAAAAVVGGHHLIMATTTTTTTTSTTTGQTTTTTTTTTTIQDDVKVQADDLAGDDDTTVDWSSREWFTDREHVADTHVSIHPYFKVHPGKMEEFVELTSQMVDLVCFCCTSAILQYLTLPLPSMIIDFVPLPTQVKANEPGNLYYGFGTFSTPAGGRSGPGDNRVTGGLAAGFEIDMQGSNAMCQEGYVDASAVVKHLANVGDMIEKVQTVADLMRIDVAGPTEELAKLKGPMSAWPVRFWNYVAGHGCDVVGKKADTPATEDFYFAINGFWAHKPEDVSKIVEAWKHLSVLTAQENGSLYYSIALPEGYEGINEGHVPILVREGYRTIADVTNTHMEHIAVPLMAAIFGEESPMGGGEGPRTLQYDDLTSICQPTEATTLREFPFFAGQKADPYDSGLPCGYTWDIYECSKITTRIL